MRIFLLITIDFILIVFSGYASLWIRFDGVIPQEYRFSYHHLGVSFIWIAAFYLLSIYKKVWRYASLNELAVIVTACSAGFAVNMMLIHTAFGGELFIVPRSVMILWWILNIVMIGGARLTWRLWINREVPLLTNRVGLPVLIYGAGNAGAMVARELRTHRELNLAPVGFIDDDQVKKDLQVAGLPVLGNRDQIKSIVSRHGIKQIIIAMPTATGKTVRDIIKICEDLEVKVKIFPGIYSMINGNVSIKTIREVQIEDLLGREEADLDLDRIKGYITGKTVLVTGAGGSIGSELSRQIMRFSPRQLILLGRGENSIYDIALELTESYKSACIKPLIADIRDESRIMRIFGEFCPDVVYHAAAHKHVPLMEDSPEEAVKNNVLGTLYLARAAMAAGTRRFVLISTDKAVNPSSVMGATKSAAEMIANYYNSISETNFVAVRFGNVLGSRGSVLPLFKRQIENGGPVTVTHPEMIRYFMTISEAAQLVIQAGALARGGEIFVLDMGDPVKIVELAETLIRLSGFEPGKDIDIVYTGVRPGEKLVEELTTTNEEVVSTENKRIFMARPQAVDFKYIETFIENLEKVGDYIDNQKAMALIKPFLVNQLAAEYGIRKIV